MVDTPWGPLPDAKGEYPSRRGKFIDIEAYSALIDNATITSATISGGTFGNATITNDLTVQASLTMGTSGLIQTATSGQRIVIANTTKNQILFYSGDADETYVGQITQGTNGTGDTRTIQFGTYTPQLEQTTASQVDAIGSFVARSGTPDGTSSAPGFVFAQSAAASGGGQSLEFRIQNAIPFLTDGDVTLSAGDLNLSSGNTIVNGYVLASPDEGSGTGYPIMRVSANSLTSVSYSFQNDPNTGIMRSGADIMEVVAGGTKYLTFDHGNTSVYMQNGGFGLGFATGTPLTAGYFYNIPPTTATAGNATWVLASGSIYYLNRSTSSVRYKSNIRPYTETPELVPVRFHADNDDVDSIGLIAEDVAATIPEAAIYNDAGEVEDYDMKVVMAAMIARINNLEAHRCIAG